MKIAIIGQQDFGKAVLEAFVARKDDIAGVFCAPEKAGARADALRVAAQERGIPVFQFASLRSPEAHAALEKLGVDLGIMAYVLQFAPDSLVNLPRRGTIQYHPSLLPRYRGPSSINWPIIRGDTQTGLTIFRPTEGLDEGPVVLQKTCAIGPDDTLGDVYFNRLFPMGVQALQEAADLVAAGTHTETVQDEAQASYEGWCREAEARIHWAHHVDHVYNLIRGCNPAPGAWSMLDGKPLKIFDAKPLPAKDPKGIAGKMGEVVAVEADGFTVVCADGRFKVARVQADGPKLAAGEWAAAAKLVTGTRLT